MTLIVNWTKEKFKVEPYTEGEKKGWKVSGTLPGGGRVRKRFPDKMTAELYRTQAVVMGNKVLEAGDHRFTRLSQGGGAGRPDRTPPRIGEASHRNENSGQTRNLRGTSPKDGNRRPESID